MLSLDYVAGFIRAPVKPTHGECYRLEVGSLLMRQFLPRVIPYLIVKRTVAELMLEYLSSIPERGGFGTPAPDESEQERRQSYRDRMRAINASGGRLAWGHARGV